MSLNQLDSLSPYRNSQDLFHVGTPSKVNVEVFLNKQPFEKDTLSLSTEKLKEEALHCLKHSSKYLIPQPGFMRIGKYLFKAVAFPPYFILYGLPKWMILTALPEMISQFILVLRSVITKLNEWVEFSSRHFIAFNQWAKQTLELLFRPIEIFFLQINNILCKLPRFFLQLLSKIEKKIHFLKLFNGKFILRTIYNQIKEFTFSHKQLIKQIAERFSNTLKGYAQILRAPSLLLKFLVNQFPLPNQKLKNAYEIALKDTNLLMNGLKKQSEILKLKLTAQLSRGKAIFLNVSTPFVNHLKHKLKKYSRNLKEFFDKKHQKFVLFLKTKQKILDSRSRLSFFNGISLYKITKWLPLKLQQYLEKFLSYFYIREIIEKLISVCYFITLLLLRSSIAILLLIPVIIKNSLKTTFHIKRAFREIKKVIENSISPLFESVKMALKKSFYYLLLGLVMLTILCFWGGTALAQMMNRITSQFSLRRS